MSTTAPNSLLGSVVTNCGEAVTGRKAAEGFTLDVRAMAVCFILGRSEEVADW